MATVKKTVKKKKAKTTKKAVKKTTEKALEKKTETKETTLTGYELIITEKPSSAKKIAEALADTKALRKGERGTYHYELTHNGKQIVITSAVGHIYGLAVREKKGWTYPVYDIEWKPSYEVNKKSEHTKKYIQKIKSLAKNASSFTVSTDFDIEGEVIGLNVIRYACKQKDANRMKFSTLTRDELIKSYENKSKHLIWGQAIAGETRHMLDWYYGINISRALTLAVRAATNKFKLLSSGRVQGPALKIIVDKEKEIQAFNPVPYWQIQLVGAARNEIIDAWHKEDKFWEKEKADKVMKKTEGQKATVAGVDSREFKQAPPVPFDLTTMQIEAYKTLRINPKETQIHAQELYTGGYISYPRTSSQKLPESIGYQKILNQLSKQENYKELCEELLKKKELKPNEGGKTDDAHPAIYPTGEPPKKLKERTAKVYDLIVRRFMATFAEPATRQTNTIEIDVNEELFIAKGTTTKEEGWHKYYKPYVKLEEEQLPTLEKGEDIAVKDITQHSKETQPPKRYTPASLVKELEKRNLGTKATRSVIVDNLYGRGYAKEQSIEATELGIKTETILEKYIPEIVDEQLTRDFEEEMEEIREGKKTQDELLKRAQKILNKILTAFKKKEKEVGKELSEATEATWKAENTVGKCPNCEEGELVIRKGKFGRFIGCNNYPDCKTIFNIPNTGFVKPTEEKCSECGHPMVKYRPPKQGERLICINPKCVTWTKEYQDKQAAEKKEENKEEKEVKSTDL